MIDCVCKMQVSQAIPWPISVLSITRWQKIKKESKKDQKRIHKEDGKKNTGENIPPNVNKAMSKWSEKGATEWKNLRFLEEKGGEVSILFLLLLVIQHPWDILDRQERKIKSNCSLWSPRSVWRRKLKFGPGFPPLDPIQNAYFTFLLHILTFYSYFLFLLPEFR